MPRHGLVLSKNETPSFQDHTPTHFPPFGVASYSTTSEIQNSIENYSIRSMNFVLYIIISQVGKKFELMNCDHHKGLMKKFKKDPASYRPDIAHQVLIMEPVF